MFREIVEGLVHIHTQGMIHRDLKPVNIFIDSKDHVKIGDFGLATAGLINQVELVEGEADIPVEEDMTGQIGTAMYVAPELGVSRLTTYNQKVDLYSLGIIFFEMCYPPLATGMERIKVRVLQFIVISRGLWFTKANTIDRLMLAKAGPCC